MHGLIVLERTVRSNKDAIFPHYSKVLATLNPRWRMRRTGNGLHHGISIQSLLSGKNTGNPSCLFASYFKYCTCSVNCTFIRIFVVVVWTFIYLFASLFLKFLQGLLSYFFQARDHNRAFIHLFILLVYSFTLSFILPFHSFVHIC